MSFMHKMHAKQQAQIIELFQWKFHLLLETNKNKKTLV